MTDTANAWRLETPGNQGWARSAHPGTANKYFMVSADCHANEPYDFLSSRIDKKYTERLPKVITDEKGERWQVTEGYRPSRLRFKQPLEGEDGMRNGSGAKPEDRLKDMAADGVDAEIIFPNKGLSIWATPDAVFAMAQCRCWNDWAWETYGRYNDRMSPTSCGRTITRTTKARGHIPRRRSNVRCTF